MSTWEKISEIYFSPSHTTQKIVEKIAGNFEGNHEIYDLLMYENRDEIREFGDLDIVIVGVPVFAGRVPEIARKKLENFRGEGVPAVVFVNKGNANLGDALIELTDILKSNGFNIVGAGEFISQHSIFSKVAAGRPDENDWEKINEFAVRCRSKIEEGVECDVKVPGNKPYCEYKIVPFKAVCDESLCTFCYDCVSVCPHNAISDDDPVLTDNDKCDGCSACIFICPEDARSFDSEVFKKTEPAFVEKFSKRQEAKFYF